MTVKELREMLWNMPDEATITLCTADDNPYDDYWNAESVVRITDVSNASYDRICLMAIG